MQGLFVCAMSNPANTRQLYTHRTGAAIAQLLRRATVDGVEYVIAPIISAREGVMNGVLYLAEELERSAPDWDGHPAPLGHPQDSAGNFISAHSDGVPAAAIVRASHWDSKTASLKHEVWVNVMQANALGGEWATLLARLERGDVIDVSTGLYAEMEPATGTHSGAPFHAIARNIQPDHIAILLNEIGACSLSDGCGVPRVNQRQEEPMPVAINYELALDEQAGMVYRAWYERNGYDAGQVRDVFADRLIVRSEGVLTQVRYTVSEDGDVEFDEPVEVDYRPIGADPASNAQAGWLSALKNHLSKLFYEEAAMDRDKMIQTILSNQRNALSQETLAGLGDDELAAYADTLKPPCANSQQPPAAPAEPAISREQFDALVESVNQLTAQIQANTDRDKQSAVADITANTDAWSEAELLGKSLAELRKIHRIVVPADYSGRGRAVANSAEGEWEDYATEEVS